LFSGLALSAAAQTPAAPATTEQAKVAVIFLQASPGPKPAKASAATPTLKKKYEPKRLQLDHSPARLKTCKKKDLQAQGRRVNRCRTRQTHQDHRGQEEARTAASLKTLRTTSSRRCRSCTAPLAAKVYKVLVAYAQKTGTRWSWTEASSKQGFPPALLDPLHRYHQGNRRSLTT